MGFEPFFRKELSDWWHSRRAGVIAIVTSLLVISVAIVPWLQVTFPPTGGTPPDVSLDPTINVLSANWVTWLTIITISAAMSLLVGERDKGTLAWSLSNPLSRQALLVAKWSAGTLMYALFGVLLPVAVVATVVTLAYGSVLDLGALTALAVALVAMPAFFIALSLTLGTQISSGPAGGLAARDGRPRRCGAARLRPERGLIAAGRAPRATRHQAAGSGSRSRLRCAGAAPVVGRNRRATHQLKRKRGRFGTGARPGDPPESTLSESARQRSGLMPLAPGRRPEEVGPVGVEVAADGSERALRASPTREHTVVGSVPAAPRLHWIDWLRVAAIAGVFVYHTFRPFDSTGWHVKNVETSDLLGAIQIFFSTFGLAVLFLLAGAGARFALRRRTWQAFLRERTARLLVPFAVGMLLLSPIQATIEAVHAGTSSGGFPYVVSWWADLPASILDHGFSPTVFGLGYHLWFLGFLFAVSVACLPVVAYLRGRHGVRTVAALAGRVAALPGSSIGFAVPIAILLFAGAVPGVEEHGWNEFGQYFAYFVIGFVFLSDERFLPAVRRDVAVAALALIASGAGLLVLDFGEWLTNEASRGLDPRSLALALLFVLVGWSSTLVVLNVGLRATKLQRPVSARLGDAVLPVYVIHQPVILAVAFFVVQWPVAILPKWIVVFGASLAITLALVDLALRTRITRVLLGARTQPAAPPVPARARVAAGEPPPVRPTAGPRHA